MNFAETILPNRFNLDAIINFQYMPIVGNISRDLEISLFQSRVAYSNSSADNFSEPAIPVFACKFCPLPTSHSLAAAADEHGTVSLHNTDALKKDTTTSRAHKNAIFDLAWVPGEAKLLTLSGDHTARLWDVCEIGIGPLSTFIGHSKSVKASDFMPNEPGTFATGSRDGSILLWDSRCSNNVVKSVFKPDQCIRTAAGSEGNKKNQVHSVTSLLFQDRHNLICCGSYDNLIRVWDMRMTHCRWKGAQPKMTYKTPRRGLVDLKMNPEKSKLYASCINSSIFCFNLHSTHSDPIAEFSGHQAGSFYVKTSISSDGQYLVSGSSDKSIYVWKTKGAELEKIPRQPLIKLTDHTAEVTGVDISLSSCTKIISCADDGTVRLWQPQPRGKSSVSPVKLSSSSDAQPCRVSPLTFIQTPPRKFVRTSELPTSVFKRKANEVSPTRSADCDAKRIVLSPKKNSVYTSPTANLPNYVLDGSGPSHSCPRLRHKENVDWLTELQRRSSSKTSGRCNSEKKTSSKNFVKKSSRRTLLEYYKKSGKACDESPAQLKVPDAVSDPS